MNLHCAADRPTRAIRSTVEGMEEAVQRPPDIVLYLIVWEAGQHGERHVDGEHR